MFRAEGWFGGAAWRAAPVASRYAPHSPMFVIGHGATRRCPRLLRQSPPSRAAARHVSWRCRGPNLVSWVRHGGPSVPSANGPLRQSRASRPAASRGSRLGQRQASTPWSVQRGLLSHFGHEGLRIFTVWLGSSPTVGLTTRCSGLASLAAELGIVRRFWVLGTVEGCCAVGAPGRGPGPSNVRRPRSLAHSTTKGLLGSCRCPQARQQFIALESPADGPRRTIAGHRWWAARRSSARYPMGARAS